MSSRSDMLIIGGGVIGLSTAYFLARDRRLRVTVVDRGEPGREASWAGAGIIPPANLQRATTPFNRLLGLSTSLYPAFSEELRERTGIDNGYRRCGGIELASGVTEETIQVWRAEGIRFERIAGAELRRLEPALSATLEDGYYQPDMAQVRNPRHLQALLAACGSLGVELLPNTPVHGFHREGSRIVAALSDRKEIVADRFLIASGAWTEQLLEPLGVRLGIHPVRGQIVLFHPGHVVFQTIILSGRNYLVPRADGRVLAGSTEEDVGFVKETTEAAIAELTRLAHSLVPELTQAPVETTWAGLRPATHDELPFLGRVPGLENLFLAAGHFRAGLMLSPGTGLVMSELIADRPTSIALDAFAPKRPRATRD